MADSVDTIKTGVLTQIYNAEKSDRKPKAIKASPQKYHLFLIAFMNQIRISEDGIELFGIPLVIDQDISDVQVFLD